MTITERKRRLQRHLEVEDDGVLGVQSIGAIEKALGIGALAVPDPPGNQLPLDPRTEKHLRTLLPEVQPVFRSLMVYAKQLARDMGIEQVKVISGSRTWAEQNALYAQGRTRPGDRVTKSRGGYSNHNFGVAVDLGCFQGRRYLDGGNGADRVLASAFYHKLAVQAKKLGLEWGGDWRSLKDTPHFEYDTGLTMAQMRDRVSNGKAIV